MTNEHLISVGMPAYNGERFIRKALESILAQEHGNFELIISDNDLQRVCFT
jgi:glycosyltransferase involved in cell wall biosynthesis